MVCGNILASFLVYWEEDIHTSPQVVECLLGSRKLLFTMHQISRHLHLSLQSSQTPLSTHMKHKDHISVAYHHLLLWEQSSNRPLLLFSDVLNLIHIKFASWFKFCLGSLPNSGKKISSSCFIGCQWLSCEGNDISVIFWGLFPSLHTVPLSVISGHDGYQRFVSVFYSVRMHQLIFNHSTTGGHWLTSRWFFFSCRQ